jgi:hypothetical protein
VIGLVLFVAAIRLRFRGEPVHRVEEEFGEAKGLTTAPATAANPGSSGSGSTPPEP